MRSIRRFLEGATLFPTPEYYTIPVRDMDETDTPAITVVYRSSMKKLQSRWVGDIPAKFTGAVRLNMSGNTFLAGSVTNQTGIDFTDVYLAFRTKDENRVIYFPKWPKNATVDLAKDLGRPVLVGLPGTLESLPGEGKVISDSIGNASVKAGDSRDHHWMSYWFGKAHGSAISSGSGGRRSESNLRVSPCSAFSIFYRFDVIRNKPDANGQSGSTDRYELFRRGGRIFNVSQSVMAGQLVVLAATNASLPMPLRLA